MNWLAQLPAFLLQPDTLASLRLTFAATCVTLPALAVAGILLGCLLGYRQGRWVSALDFLVTLPLVFPPIATGFILLVLLGRRSMIGRIISETMGIDLIFSFWSIVIAAFIAGLPLIVKQVQSAVRGETRRLIEMAYLLGRSAPATFFLVVLPSIRRNIAIGLSLACARSLGEVGVTLMLGGNIAGRTNTVSLEIYNAVFSGEYDRAFALVLLLGFISLLLIILTRRMTLE